MDQYVASRSLGSRLGAALDRAESLYLRILRAFVLIVATVLILFAIWLACTSLYKLSRSTSSVHEKVASVSASDLVMGAKDDDAAVSSKSDDQPKNSKEQISFYAGVLNRYYGLYKAKFERYVHDDDKKLSREEFDDLTLTTSARLAAIRDAKLDFGQDRGDLQSLMTTMDDSATEPSTLAALQKYRVAKKVPVTQQVQKSRSQIRRGWNRYSTACPDWYNVPMGCSDTRVVEVPYTETVTSMEYPSGTRSPVMIFRSYQDRFFKLMGERREANATEAEAKRTEILAGNVNGRSGLMTALEIVGGFLLLMFFFLLIAIERHQRLLAREV